MYPYLPDLLVSLAPPWPFVKKFDLRDGSRADPFEEKRSPCPPLSKSLISMFVWGPPAHISKSGKTHRPKPAQIEQAAQIAALGTAHFGRDPYPTNCLRMGLTARGCLWDLGPLPHTQTHPEVGVSASQAVRGVSGCGVGAPNPIVKPALSTPRSKNLWGRGPAQNELQHTLVGERPVRFEQVWDAVFSRT